MSKEPRFISPMSDYGFKVAFADETNTLFLRKALQAVIGSTTEIKEVKFTRNEQKGLTIEARGGVYDVFCKDESDRYFIVEMQLGRLNYYIQRAKFYTFHRFNIMVGKGDYKFDNLTKIYCVGFLAFDLFPNSKEYYHFCTLKNQIGELIDDQIVHVIIEIRKFEKELHELETDLDKLIYFMKNLQSIENLDPQPLFLNEEWIRRTVAQLDCSKMTKEERHDFEVAMAKNASIIYSHEKEKKEFAKQKILDAARRLKKKGIDKEIIAETHNLTIAEVEKL